jgi:hypothetical protein
MRACYTSLVMQAAACAFHAQREALGVCVACRSRVCAECTTKVEGINYCVRCLAQRARSEAEPVTLAVSTSRGRAAVGALFWAALLWLLLWGLLQIALPEAA